MKPGKKHDTLTGYDFREDAPLSRSKAIREKCLECCNQSRHEVKCCQIYDCPLWPYRLGSGVTQDTKGENVKKRKTRNLSPEQREAAAQRMRDYHAKKKKQK